MAEICVKNLKKHFGDATVLDIPELNIEKGDFLGLVGNNGAGKTTFFRLMLDLIKADDGEVYLDGINPAKSEKWKSMVGAYLGDGFLIDYLMPEEYFEFIGKLNGIASEEIDHRLTLFDKLMNGEILGKSKLIREYSAGNRQKIGIIAAMITYPDILILDEPFNFLDPSSQLHLCDLLTDYHRNSGATIIISSHNLGHITSICSRIAVMEKGRIIRDMQNDSSAETVLKEYFV